MLHQCHRVSLKNDFTNIIETENIECLYTMQNANQYAKLNVTKGLKESVRNWYNCKQWNE